jgi:hypothetical protein
MKEPLLVRPRPYPAESPNGFLSRVMESNGWCGSSALLRQLNAKGLFTIAASDPDVVEQLERRLELPRGALEHVAYFPSGSTRLLKRQFLGHAILGRFLEKSRARFCPICVGQVPMRRALWDLWPVMACPDHGLWLESKCPHCDAEQTWGRTQVAHCWRCETWLPLSPKRNAPAPLQWLARAIQDSVAHADTREQDRALPHVLEVFELVLLVLSGGGSDGRGSPVSGCLDQEETTSYALHAARVMESGPSELSMGFQRQLARQARGFPALGTWPWRVSLERLFRRQPFNETRFDAWRRTIQMELRCNGQMMASGDVAARVPPSTLVTSRELAQWLGVSIREMRSQRAQYWLNQHGLQRKYGTEQRVSLHALEALAGRWLRNCEESRSMPQDFVTIAKLLALGPRRWRVEIWDVLDACAQGGLGLIRWKAGQSPNELGVSLAQVQTLKYSDPSDWDHVSVSDAARAMGIYADALRRLAKAGLFPLERRRCPDGYYRDVIASSDLASFRDAYAFTGELAARANDTPQRFADKLEAEGIRPVSGPGIDRGLVYLFRRVDLDRVDWGTIAARRGAPTRSGRPTIEAVTLREHHQSGLYTSTEAAAALEISAQMLWRLVRLGVVKCLPIRKDCDARKRFCQKAIATLLEKTAQVCK